MFTDLHRPKNAKPVSVPYQMEVRALDDIALKYCYWIYIGNFVSGMG